jgi:hypothetical protein
MLHVWALPALVERLHRLLAGAPGGTTAAPVSPALGRT